MKIEMQEVEQPKYKSFTIEDDLGNKVIVNKDRYEYTIEELLSYNGFYKINLTVFSDVGSITVSADGEQSFKIINAIRKLESL